MADWLKKPDVILAIVLYVTAPAWVWFAGWLKSRYESRSELAARVRMEYLQNKVEHPPTLVESLAFIICFLPLPFAMAMVWPVLYFSPPPPAWLPTVQDPRTAHVGIEIVREVLFLVFFCTYTLFGVLTVHGIYVAFLLRHGAAHYADNYKTGVQKRINKLRKKYPHLK
jgi:hypothetical protein